MAILTIAMAFGWTGITISFISNLIFGYTALSNIISYFSYSTIPIGSFAVVSVSWNLLFSSKNRKLGLGFFCALYLIYYLFLFMTWNQTVLYSNVPGLVYDDWLSHLSVSFWMIWIIVGLSAAIWAIGFNRFRTTSPGELQKRALKLLIMSFFIGTGILLDTVVFTGAAFVDFVWISRVIMIPGIYYGYVGLSPI